MRCHDYDLAVGRVQRYQPKVLSVLADLEGAQLDLEGAAVWLGDEDAERVQAATQQIRMAIMSLREAESALGEVNEAMRVRLALG